MRPDPALDAARHRSALRRLVRDRGPDTGREVDHLKFASDGGRAEELLLAVEAGAASYGRTVTLTTATGGLGFMLGVSKLAGSDTI